MVNLSITSSFFQFLLQCFKHLCSFTCNSILYETRNRAFWINVWNISDLCLSSIHFLKNESCNPHLCQLCILVKLSCNFNTPISDNGFVSLNIDGVDSNYLSVRHRSWHFHDDMNNFQIIFLPQFVKLDYIILKFSHEFWIWKILDNLLEGDIDNGLCFDGYSSLNIHFPNFDSFIALDIPLGTGLEDLHGIDELCWLLLDVTLINSLHFQRYLSDYIVQNYNPIKTWWPEKNKDNDILHDYDKLNIDFISFFIFFYLLLQCFKHFSSLTCYCILYKIMYGTFWVYVWDVCHFCFLIVYFLADKSSNINSGQLCVFIEFSRIVTTSVTNNSFVTFNFDSVDSNNLSVWDWTRHFHQHVNYPNIIFLPENINMFDIFLKFLHEWRMS